jgi:hypothetical protein
MTDTGKGSMSERRPFRLTTALFLAAPLVGIIVVMVLGARGRSFGPGPAAPPTTPGASAAGTALANGSATAAATAPAATATATTGSVAAAAGLPELPGLGKAEGDFPPDRFWERVDGAADALIAAGCARLLVWRSADPAAEVEVLQFAAPEGAAKILAHDAGADRNPGPGDEASVSDQAVFFRRGKVYVRVVGDALAPPTPAGLLALARKVDIALPVLAGGGGS